MLSHNEINGMRVLRPEFSFDLKNVVKMKTFFTDYFKNPGNGIILDMSQVQSIDSVGFKSVTNLLASLQKIKTSLLIFTDNRNIAEQIRNVVKDVRVVESEVELQDSVLSGQAIGALIATELECPVCANRDLPRRAVNWEKVQYVFPDSSFLPQGINPDGGGPIELFKQGVIVCSDCLFASFYHSDFIRLSGETRIQPSYSLEIKNLLIKTTNRRRDVFLRLGLEQSQFKEALQSYKFLEAVYRLTADCITSVSFDKALNRFYEAGLSNLLVYLFMAEGKKDAGLLEKADSFFKDCIRFKPDTQKVRIWQSYYFRIVLTFLTAKPGASLALLDAFRKERESAPAPEYAGFDFWLNQSVRVHKQEIHDVVSKLL